MIYFGRRKSVFGGSMELLRRSQHEDQNSAYTEQYLPWAATTCIYQEV